MGSGTSTNVRILYYDVPLVTPLSANIFYWERSNSILAGLPINVTHEEAERKHRPLR
jgi:hypothetical protein